MGLTREEIFEKVQDIIVTKLAVEKSKVTLDADFVNDLNADSLDIVELVMSFEETFDIRVPDTDTGRILLVRDAVDLVESLEAT